MCIYFHSQLISDNVCELPIVTGPCEAYMSSWGHNSVTKRCEHFGYGGCHGNGNRFSSKEDCEAKCQGLYILPVIYQTYQIHTILLSEKF